MMIELASTYFHMRFIASEVLHRRLRQDTRERDLRKIQRNAGIVDVIDAHVDLIERMRRSEMHALDSQCTFAASSPLTSLLRLPEIEW